MNKIEKIFIILLVLGFICLFFHDRYLANKLDNQPLQSTVSPISTVVKSIVNYKDSSGRNHVVFLAKSNTIKEDKAKLAGTVGILDTAAKALKIQADKIDQLTKVNLQIAQENLTLKLEKRDSLKKTSYYRFKDKNLDLLASKVDTSNFLTGEYKINTDLNWVDYSKRKWFLGSRIQYTDIFSDNNNITITGVNRVSIQHQPSQFGLRLKAATRYNFSSNTFGIGPGAEISIGRFDIAGYYYYNPTPTSSINWRPVLNIDYNLFSF